jgi:hypothetical protein
LDVLDLGNGLHVVYIYLFDRVYLWRLVRRFTVLWEIFFCFFLIFSDAWSSFLRSRLVAPFFIFAREGTK